MLEQMRDDVHERFALFQRASADYNAPAAPGGNSYGVLNAYPGKLVPLPGGQPISSFMTTLFKSPTATIWSTWKGSIGNLIP
jgi:hypothetical protein